ncbi:MAG: hypothetical protein EBU01_09990 [Crocinitomicaceae bacterium]|nr:hypothetical protein [Crocinitomicaceae bacterium]
MDNQWKDTLKQKIAISIRFWLIKPRYDFAFLPGLRQQEYALKLGFPQEKIWLRALNGDERLLNNYVSEGNIAAFLYVGRLSSEKGIVQLLDAYKEYFSSETNPWKLHVVGDGPLRNLIEGTEGIHWHGFLNPNTFANCSFKSVVLFNADSLTSDAQSSLRRCIEQNSNTTRFFIVVQNINSLLDPILSRFSLIFFNKLIEDKPTFFLQNELDAIICDKFSQFLNMEQTYIESIKSIVAMADYFNSKGISCINLVEFVRKNKNWWDDDKHCSMCFVFFNNNCLQIKNEKIIMYLFMLKLFID